MITIWMEVILDDRPSEDTQVTEAAEAEELSGKLASSPDEERLAHSVLENDEQTIRDGQMLAESVDYALGSFTPDLMFEQITKNYRNAQRLYGPTIIRELTGYDGSYIEKNLKIEEFKEKLAQNIAQNINRLRKDGLLDDDGSITDRGLDLAALAIYAEELDHLKVKGVGRKEKDRSHYGERAGTEPFRKHRYKDVDIRGSIKRAMRRGHTFVSKEDLVASTREQPGGICVVYALDASGSMRGEKLHLSKRAGIALAYRAIEDGNSVGLIVFTSRIRKSIAPTRDFGLLLHELTDVRAGQETDIGLAISESAGLFPKRDQTKHIILLSDALPTSGDAPGKGAMDAVANARDAGVTLSVVGINLEHEGEKLARKMVELGEGKLYRCANLQDLDLVILEDYEMVGRKA